MTQIELELVEADLSNPDHGQSIIELLDVLACSPDDGQPLPDDVRQVLISRMREFPGTLVFLAFAEQIAVGLAICFPGFSTFRAAPLLNIHDLAVRPEYRGRGVARRLLGHIEQRARETGCRRLTLEVREDNLKARQLYESFGFDPGKPGASAHSFFIKSL